MLSRPFGFPPCRRYLQRYKKTGQCTVMHTTRLVTALHKEVRGCELLTFPVQRSSDALRCCVMGAVGRSALPANPTARPPPPMPQGHSFPLTMTLKEVKQGESKAYMVGQRLLQLRAACLALRPAAC